MILFYSRCVASLDKIKLFLKILRVFEEFFSRREAIHAQVPQRKSESYLAASPFLLTSYNIVPGYGGGNFGKVISGKEAKMENNNA